jgi:hypothetical protein
MKTKLRVTGFAFAAMLVTAAPVEAGGRYPLSITKVGGDVQVRLIAPGSRWKKANAGMQLDGPYLLRTGPRSYAHLQGNFRCVDANSLIQINHDSEASIDVLSGQMSAVDGKPGKSMPDVLASR